MCRIMNNHRILLAFCYANHCWQVGGYSNSNCALSTWDLVTSLHLTLQFPSQVILADKSMCCHTKYKCKVHMLLKASNLVAHMFVYVWTLNLIVTQLGKNGLRRFLVQAGRLHLIDSNKYLSALTVLQMNLSKSFAARKFARIVCRPICEAVKPPSFEKVLLPRISPFWQELITGC